MKVFPDSFKGISRKIKVCFTFHEVLSGFQGVSRMSQGSFRGVPRDL